MLNLQLKLSTHYPLTIFQPKSFVVAGRCRTSVSPLAAATRLCPRHHRRQARGGRINAASGNHENADTALVFAANSEEVITVKVDVAVKLNVFTTVTRLGLSIRERVEDFMTDFCGRALYLELLSAELDPRSGEEKEKASGYGRKMRIEKDVVIYEATLEIKKSFGKVGAVRIRNEHHTEMYVKSIKLKGLPYAYEDDVHITANSWVHAHSNNPDPRIFFTNKSYLPSETPSGLRHYRAEELEAVRGDGSGERKYYERIYDYDTYNDLGNPDDEEKDLARPILGGEEHPYPRRCRTGRPRTHQDSKSESRSLFVYVPMDEAFSQVKTINFGVKALSSVLRSLLPSLEKRLKDRESQFPHFTAIDTLFKEGITLPNARELGLGEILVPRLVKAIEKRDLSDRLLLFETPELLERDKFSWFRDEEFSRQTLAGLNPMSIQLVTEFPLKSNLDPEVYGDADSLITKKVIEHEINGIMTLEEALEGNKLFILDYHDLLLPYVEKVRDLGGTTLYGSRTLFFLTEENTLKPIAIELTRPKTSKKPQWRYVFTPGSSSTSCWLWKLAKTHVCSHDSGYHQLVIHWLRTHCCTEPYIIATNRQLSTMHPIYKLLHPHFRFTMEINALAREALINAEGVIETCFFSGKYSMELSSVAYDKLWRFDLQSLPADLISRGMAVEDPTAEHGLKLTIEDYPFAADGLLLWSAIKKWVHDYVNHYYSDPTLVASDSELQAWWNEIKSKGHPDKKEGWPALDSPSDLIHILTTMIWVASGHHAAVNFGQYDYAGYFPNRPTISRTNLPVEDFKLGSSEFERFYKIPELTLLECFPSQLQATKVMAILDVLSTHSDDEEYLGEEREGLIWDENPIVAAAFKKFSGRLTEIEGIIDGRNANWRLRNRNGAGIMPYELLKPYSEPGVTSMGVPNSISI